MTRFTVPEELLGSISVQGMKQDNYRRITTNRMPLVWAGVGVGSAA